MLVFVVKQKTAYELRISDWSSDVCSSDLEGVPNGLGRVGASGQLGQHLLEPRQHICDDRSGFSLAHRQPVFGAGASDTSLDPVKAGDPPQRLLGYRGIATFGEIGRAHV